MHKITTQFNGGIAQNSKNFLPNSFRFAKNLNVYTDDDSVTLNPKPLKVSGSIVTDLVKWITDVYPAATDKYAYGDTGNLYKITSGEVWSVDRSGATIGNGAAGQGLGFLDDAMYYATATTLGRKYPLSLTPAYNDDFLTDGVNNVDLSVAASGNTYTPPVAISESATALCTIVPTKDPLKTVQVYVTTKGTGNWTVTVHDGANNSLGTATIANGSLTNGAMNSFAFATPLRVKIGQSYHFHVTSTVADGTLQTGTSADLSTAQYATLFGILISDSLYHPIAQHTNGVTGTIVIGNEHYIAEWTGIAYNPNKITITPGYSIRLLTRENEFIVAMAWKGTTIDAFEEGRAFYWDGISPYYNYSLPITGGAPNAAVNFKNRVLTVHGTNGLLSLGTQPFKAIQPAPLLTTGKTIEVLPGAITVWQNRAHIGIGANSTDSTGLVQGVYEYGNQSDRAVSYTSVSTEVLNLGYVISTGDTQGTTMKIGCVWAQGTQMYIGWKAQDGSFGVDKVTKTNSPAATGSWESLIEDQSFVGGVGFMPAPQKPKEAKVLVIKYNTLPAGCTVTPKYRINRAASWTLGTNEQIGVAGSTSCSMQINQRYFEIEYGFDLAATSNYPVITGVYYSFNPLMQERNFS